MKDAGQFYPMARDCTDEAMHYHTHLLVTVTSVPIFMCAHP